MQKLWALWMYINNFGDLLTPFIFENLFNINVIPIKKELAQSKIITIPFILGCGSLIQYYYLNNSYIWGTGFIKPTKKIKGKPKEIWAVRGPLSRKILITNNVKCPKNYADAGILLGDIFNKKIKKEYLLGIIPHYVERKVSLLKKYKQNKDIIVIDLTNPIETIVKKAKACQYIISSSLHGIILADTFHIPRLPIKLSNSLIGGGFKFKDYNLSVGINFSRFNLNKFITVKNLIKHCLVPEINLEIRKNYLKKEFNLPFVKKLDLYKYTNKKIISLVNTQKKNLWGDKKLK